MVEDFAMVAVGPDFFGVRPSRILIGRIALVAVMGASCWEQMSRRGFKKHGVESFFVTLRDGQDYIR